MSPHLLKMLRDRQDYHQRRPYGASDAAAFKRAADEIERLREIRDGCERMLQERKAEIERLLAQLELQRKAGQCDAEFLTEDDGKIACGWQRTAERLQAALKPFAALCDKLEKKGRWHIERDDGISPETFKAARAAFEQKAREEK